MISLRGDRGSGADLLEKPSSLNLVAWARLVKVYGVLRMDDMQRIKPAEVGFDREVEEDQDNGSREGDWSPASFLPKRIVRGGPDMDAERL